MKFLVDVCAESRPLRRALLAAGHDVLFASERFADAKDEVLLEFAWSEGRVLITEDNGFGALVFLQRLPHAGIVRLVGMTPEERADAMGTLIERHAEAMLESAIVVVTRERIRIRTPDLNPP